MIPKQRAQTPEALILLFDFLGFPVGDDCVGQLAQAKEYLENHQVLQFVQAENSVDTRRFGKEWVVHSRNGVKGVQQWLCK